MENKKSNKGVIVILIILIIMVLALGSYIVYDKFFNTENDKKVTENNVKDEKLVIIDSPPGTSCATVSAVEHSDFARIVTEPTPFGLNDMKMVVEMLREMGMPFGVFVNKADLGDMEVYDYCREENIEILGEIPFDKDIANYYSKGEIFSKYIPHYKEVFENLLQAVLGGKNGN